ncbi:hypothetical protein ACS8FA_07545 [Psychrobacter sp. 1Y1]|uniref:hypothetical protein n=1 Tax=Psychrobacter sp. 1Y1 TaxID=3453574 RepID=UPI003F47B3B2
MSMLEQLNRSLSLQLANVMESDGEELEEEIKRTKAVTDISKQILDGHRIVLDATKFAFEKMQQEVDFDKSLLSVGYGGLEGPKDG